MSETPSKTNVKEEKSNHPKDGCVPKPFFIPSTTILLLQYPFVLDLVGVDGRWKGWIKVFGV